MRRKSPANETAGAVAPWSCNDQTDKVQRGWDVEREYMDGAKFCSATAESVPQGPASASCEDLGGVETPDSGPRFRNPLQATVHMVYTINRISARPARVPGVSLSFRRAKSGSDLTLSLQGPEICPRMTIFGLVVLLPPQNERVRIYSHTAESGTLTANAFVATLQLGDKHALH